MLTDRYKVRRELEIAFTPEKMVLQASLWHELGRQVGDARLRGSTLGASPDWDATICQGNSLQPAWDSETDPEIKNIPFSNNVSRNFIDMLIVDVHTCRIEEMK